MDDDSPKIDASDLGVQTYTVDGLDPEKSTHKDPINLLFAGSLGTISALLPEITGRLGCRHDKVLGNQWFCEPDNDGPCHLQDLNRATAAIAVDFRYHTRLYQINRPASGFGGAVTAAPIHHEKLGWYRSAVGRMVKGRSPITDIPDGFNNARDWAADVMSSAGFLVYQIRLGNLEKIRQADGTPVASDGYAVVVSDQPLSIESSPKRVKWLPPS